MKIGIIGANGFIGSSLCKMYINKGYEVFAFYNQNTNAIPDGCKIFSIESIPDINFDYVLISIGSHGLNHKDYLNQYSFLERLLNKIKFIKIIFISSVEVFGKNHDVINQQSSFVQPSIYGQSKLSQEFLVKSFNNFLIIRPTYIYGTGMNQNSLIPIWSKFANEKREIIIFGDGQRKQDYLHIDDLTNLCFLATITEKETNNIIIAATGNSVSNYEIAKEISDNIPNTIIKFKGDDKTSSLKFDVCETQLLYGWKPKISIKEGIYEYIKNENFNF